MKDALLERGLLRVYKLAVRQNNLVVADHLLSALEACAPPDDALSDAVAEAYRALAVSAIASEQAPATGSRSGT